MRGRLIAALILLVIGIAWILDIQGLTIFPGGWSVWWPSLLIALGAVSLIGGRGEWRGGVILIVLGGVFQLWTLGYLPGSWWKYAGPVALILLAILILIPRSARSRARRMERWREREEYWHERGEWRGSSKIGPEDVAVFSCHRLDAPEGEYRGGELTAVFGTLEADLRRTKLPAEGARLKASGVFGAVRMRVPADWRIDVHGTPVLGSVHNRTATVATGPTLVIEAAAVFGTVEITN